MTTTAFYTTACAFAANVAAAAFTAFVFGHLSGIFISSVLILKKLKKLKVAV
jgi:hypothetical protein